MINRRSFLSLLAAIPGLGWVQPQSIANTRSHVARPNEPEWPPPEMFIVSRIDTQPLNGLRKVEFRSLQTGRTVTITESLSLGLIIGDCVESSRTWPHWVPVRWSSMRVMKAAPGR